MDPRNFLDKAAEVREFRNSKSSPKAVALPTVPSLSRYDNQLINLWSYR